MMRAAWLVAVACGSPHEPPSATSTVTLREPGAAPRHVVQYTPRAATRHVRVIAGDARFPRTMTFLVDVDLAAGTTPIHARFHGVDALVPQGKGGSGSDAPDPQIGTFVRNVAGTLASDVHGRATANADSDRVWTAPSIPNALTMAIVPLPAEAIGVGARWRVTGADPALQVSNASFDYEATAIDADGVTVRWTGSATSGGTAIPIEGTATVRFSDVIPVHATVTQHVPAQPPDIPTLDMAITIE